MRIKLECPECSNEFVISTEQWKVLGLNQLPKRCPQCADVAQRRRPWDTVVERELLDEWRAVKIAIPSEWFERLPAQRRNDRPFVRATVKGDRGQGVSWTGRIDIYDFRSGGPGSIGDVRLMHVTKKAGKPTLIGCAERRERLADELEADARETMAETGSPEPDSNVSARVAELRTEAHDMRSRVTSEMEGQIAREGALFHRDYQYLVIEDSEFEEPTSALVFARADYKTTLKGFGRQYHATLDVGEALWSVRLSSSCRSGRYGSEMAVAIVGEAPVVARTTGDVEDVRAWSMAYPWGRRMD